MTFNQEGDVRVAKINTHDVSAAAPDSLHDQASRFTLADWQQGMRGMQGSVTLDSLRPVPYEVPPWTQPKTAQQLASEWKDAYFSYLTGNRDAFKDFNQDLQKTLEQKFGGRGPLDRDPFGFGRELAGRFSAFEGRDNLNKDVQGFITDINNLLPDGQGIILDEKLFDGGCHATYPGEIMGCVPARPDPNAESYTIHNVMQVPVPNEQAAQGLYQDTTYGWCRELSPAGDLEVSSAAGRHQSEQFRHYGELEELLPDIEKLRQYR